MDPLQVNQCSDWLCQGDIKNYIQHNKKNVTLIREIFHQNRERWVFFSGNFLHNWGELAALRGETEIFFAKKCISI